MRTDMKSKKKIELDKLTTEEAELAATELGEFVGKKMLKAIASINKEAKKYGLEFHTLYELTILGNGPRWNNISWYRHMLEEALDKAKKESEPESEQIEVTTSKTRKNFGAKQSMVTKGSQSEHVKIDTDL
jgi:hypothetical protein